MTPPAALTSPGRLAEVPQVDLPTLRLLLRHHLDDLRRRGVGEQVLRPIEAELRRFDAMIDQLVEEASRPSAP
ncbi:MAG TPA: hypothetical protein VI248_29025 [Kineosporiaceae bacterium]